MCRYDLYSCRHVLHVSHVTSLLEIIACYVPVARGKEVVVNQFQLCFDPAIGHVIVVVKLCLPQHTHTHTLSRHVHTNAHHMALISDYDAIISSGAYTVSPVHVPCFPSTHARPLRFGKPRNRAHATAHTAWALTTRFATRDSISVLMVG